jgi:hypothetical protein
MRITKVGFILFAMFFVLVGCQDNSGAPEEAAQSATEASPDIAADQPKAEADAPRRNFGGFGVPRGLLNKTDESTPGYVYFTPLKSSTTYLINMDGQVVHTWESEYGPTGWVYLKDDGNLIRGGRDPQAPVYAGGGQGGWFQEFTWDGELVWEYNFSSNEYLVHHDVELMPNGNYLAIAWEGNSADEVVAAGRIPEEVPKAGLWPDWVVELQPKGSDDVEIVWEWHISDHLIQDFDESKENYGVVADHPELLDINLGHLPDPMTQEELDKKRAADDASTNNTVDNVGSDFYHTNAINYNAELDQIALSLSGLDEIIIIDHSTSSEEAAGHDGGRWGKGGDFLYRWGNPQNYGRGDESARKLGGQHDVKWIPPGYPGAGNLTVYNNNVPGQDPTFSSVLELVTPLTNDGYAMNDNGLYGPASPVWSFEAEDPLTFYSPFISGAHRMSNGNTLITEGAGGRFFEVDADKNVVWEYRTPYAGYVKNPDGTSPQPVGPFLYATFRATHVPADHSAVAGRVLMPLDPQPTAYQPPE